MGNKLNHVSFIMDGNGRWAKSKNKSRTYGHLQGINVIPKIIEYSIKQKINNLSFFAFSTENWNRSKSEVTFLLKLLEKNLSKKIISKANEYGVKVIWIGFEKNLSKSLVKKIRFFEEQTKDNNVINVYFYFNYGFKDECDYTLEKIKSCKNENTSFKDFLLTKNVPQIDLLIRTSGEKRLSNFSFYQLLYSEIIFEQTLWPDYNVDIYSKNIEEFYLRKRRYGKA